MRLQVIDACATVPRNDAGTWITDDMILAYKALHQRGHAHSVEIWDDENLVGGLYGVAVGKVFCGESMFHTVTNTSKLAMLHLVNLVNSDGALFIDCQMQNAHLASLGCCEVTREQFLSLLSKQNQRQFSHALWQARFLEATI
ncbi:leucyl/phenylalanyl-tRNA--protein transferase [Paraglaciecola aquimarina]|uniref:leucyl/phenylalanyl-tRNA--protein transferase n=1 Tax=Paraglaciecola aquimarina TaxID=1235557 RepID=UPI003D1746AE